MSRRSRSTQGAIVLMAALALASIPSLGCGPSLRGTVSVERFRAVV